MPLPTTTALALVLMAATPQLDEPAQPPEPVCESRAIGAPWSGRLVCGRQLPPESDTFVTWDFPQGLIPNRPWRRWGTEKLVDTVNEIAADYRTRFGDDEARLVVGDLSRTHGGPFGPRYGGVGHNSHQNGLDVDIYYPRHDGIELPPFRPRQIDRRRAQWVVNRAARADAKYVFIGPQTGLRRSRRVVRFLATHHEDHLHLRIRP